MAGVNGHNGNWRHSGVESPEPYGGMGGGLLTRPQNARADLALLERAARKGWNVPDALLSELPDIAVKIAKDESAGPRTQLRAVECLRAMTADNVAAVVALDKINRLDAGTPTENVGHRVYEVEFDRNG